MIMQSLGGMEIGVGMSLLAGGLVLDKSELVQGSELPINYFFTSTPMPLTSNVYPLGKVSTPSAGMIVVIMPAAVLTAVSLTLRFALLWSTRRELAGMLTNWMSGTTAMPSSDSPSPLIRTESSG